MKKMIVALLILVMGFAMLMTGCGGSGSASESDTPDSVQNDQSADSTAAEEDQTAETSTKGMGDLLSSAYVDMMKSSQYLMSYKVTMDYNGQSTEMEATIAVMGDDMAMNSTGEGFESNLIIKGDRVYMIDHESKTVTSWPQTQEGVVPVETGSFNTEGITYLDTGKEDGLVYEEYTAGDTDFKYYFQGKDLVKIAVTAEGQTTVMEILEMSGVVPADMFEIPAGYQEIKM